jgi:hypothetical protein
MIIVLKKIPNNTTTKPMKNKLILALICLLASCQSYRAERKINKLKQWGYLSDSTIVRYDTIRGWSLDSVYIFDTTTLTDTINIVKNGIKSVTVIKWKERQVTQLITQHDTILEHKFTTKVIKEPRNWWDKFKIGLIFGSLLVVFMFYSAYKLSDK